MLPADVFLQLEKVVDAFWQEEIFFEDNKELYLFGEVRGFIHPDFLLPVCIRLHPDDALKYMSVFVLVFFHHARQQRKGVDQFTGEHVRPVMLAGSFFFFTSLGEH